MPPGHGADLNSNYGRSNDECPRDVHQSSSGAASGYDQHSCNTVATTTTQCSTSLYPGQTQITCQSSPAAALGYFSPLNVSVALPQMTSPHSVPLQIIVQPSVGIGNVPQLTVSINLQQIPTTWPSGQLQIQHQPPSEPALVNDTNELDQIPSGSRLGSASIPAYSGQTHSTGSPSFEASFGNGQQLYDSSVSTQMIQSGQEPQHVTSEVCTSSMGSEQSQSTQLLSSRTVFSSPTSSRRQGSTNETHHLSSNESRLSAFYPGQHQNTYEPHSDPAFCREQLYSIPYQAQRDGTECSNVPQELNSDIRPTTIYCEEPQSTYLSSFQPPSDYPFDSSRSQVLSSALESVNQGHPFSPNYRGSHSCEIVDPSPFQQITSPRNWDNTSLKRTADEVYPLWSELDSSGQPPTAPSSEDAQRPHKRLNNGSTSCVREERMRALAATSHNHDSRNPELFSVDCRISQDQRMGLPFQSERASDRYEVQNDTSMFRDAYGFSISGFPTFTTIGKQVNKQSGAHELEILTKFVSFDALHDSSVQDPDRRCLPGTRENVLARLQGWIDDSSTSERVVWLHGLPGTGKSSIAQTITRLCGRKKVVATFFFYRSDPSRNDGNRLFTTIAWQLASSFPGVKTYLVNSLTHRPDLPTKDVETQFEELIVQPFRPLNDSVSHPDLPPAPVVVIDGVDECANETLQQRILNVIGNAIRDRRVPLRFLILSRPEAHIKETVGQFECPTLRIDLYSIDNANHDIELYLNKEFSRIARKREFDTMWPGDCIVQRLVCNSSGQFVYAATVIRYVGDAYNCAKAQLDIIMGLRERPSVSPFAPLDELYTEILKRQPDQDFLKAILTLLVACSSIEHYDQDLHADFPKLLNVSEEEMGRKLRGMQSLLAVKECHISIFHRSFLDFLQDMSRSGRYFISEQASSRRYLGLIIDVIVRFVSDVLNQPQCHDTHLHLEYSKITNWWPLQPKLSVEDLREVIQPLMDLQDKLLNQPSCGTRKLLSCNKCNTFEIIRKLSLHLALKFRQAESYCTTLEGDYSTTAALAEIEAENNISDMDLDTNLALLLAYMRNMPSTSSPTVSVLELTHSLLRFDCVEIVKKVSSVLDAQNLINLIDQMLHDQNSVQKGGMNLTTKAIQLVLDIYMWIPVLPQRNGNAPGSTDKLEFDEASEELAIDPIIENLCKGVVISGVLNNCHFVVHGPGPLVLGKNDMLSCIDDSDSDWAKADYWRTHSNPSDREMYQIMLRLSKSIQYIHSVGIVLDNSICTDAYSISLYSGFTFDIWSLDIERLKLNKNAYEDSVFTFGRLFYQIFFNINFTYPIDFEYRSSDDRMKLQRKAIVERPSKPKIRGDAWKLIQQCCAEDPKSRPTMDEVVQEMESWGIESEIAMPSLVDGDSCGPSPVVWVHLSW